MEQPGFLKVYRKLQDNPLWQDKPFSRGQAWIDLLFLANLKQSSFFKRGTKIVVERGQVGRSMKGLSDRWGWSRAKTKLFLSYLQNEHQIEHQINNLTTLITIVNFDEYNKPNTKTDTKPTPEQHQTDTYKEVKKVKNEKKEIYGIGENVKLTSAEHQKLGEKLNGSRDLYIDRLSTYNKVDQYKSHYLTILGWYSKDQSKHPNDTNAPRGKKL